jgi:hypothetical protein
MTGRNQCKETNQLELIALCANEKLIEVEARRDRAISFKA